MLGKTRAYVPHLSISFADILQVFVNITLNNVDYVTYFKLCTRFAQMNSTDYEKVGFIKLKKFRL